MRTKNKTTSVTPKQMTEQTYKKEALSTSLGARLENARKKKRLELEEISQTLRINVHYLEALEKSQYYVFPARSYAIGFLRSYAKYLKLNPDEIVELYYKETNTETETPLNMLVIKNQHSLPTVKIILISLLCLFFLYLLWYVISVNFYPDSLQEKQSELLEKITTPVESTNEEEKVTSEETLATPTVVEEPKIREISEEVYSAPVALVAIERIWMRIKDDDNDKILVDKVFEQNEHFIPPASLDWDDVLISTGRANAVQLYKKGEKFKKLSKEQETSLEDLTDD